MSARERPIESVAVRLPIRLGQFLKLSGLADTGSMATQLIADGFVSVDGAVEFQRGRQLRSGEIVSVTDGSWTGRARVADADEA